MLMKKFIKEILGLGKKEPVEKFDDVLKKLTYEALKGKNSWEAIQLGKLSAYQEIKNFKPGEKIELVFDLAEKIQKYDHDLKSKAPGGGSTLYRIRAVHYKLLESLLKSFIPFSEKQIVQLIEIWRKNSRGYYTFAIRWPVNSALMQVEKLVQKQGLSPYLKNWLEQCLEYADFQHEQKLKDKVEKILFEATYEKQDIPPVYFGINDVFGEKANEVFQEMKPEDLQRWFVLLHLAKTANGSKPSNKFLKNAQESIKTMGIDNYEKILLRWFDIVIHAKEKAHHYYHGNYIDYAFLSNYNATLLKGLIWSCSFNDNSSVLQTLTRLAERSYKKIPGTGPAAAALGNACLYVLANANGTEGVNCLSRLKLKVQQSNTKKLIDQYIEKVSEKLGITPEEVEDMAVPDFNLNDGKVSCDFDGYQLKLTIEKIGKVSLQWITPEGKTQKSVPAFVNKTPEHAAQLKAVKATAKLIQKNLSLQRDRLDRSYLYDRELSFDYFQKYYLDHGLMRFLTCKLIWRFIQGERITHAIWFNGNWKDVKGNTINGIGKDTVVQLWHPLHAETEEILAWRDFLIQHQIVQPFKQAFREVYLLTEAELNTAHYSNRMAAHILKQHQLNALAALRGWKYQLLGNYDDGRYGEVASIPIKKNRLTAEYWINEVHAEEAFNDTGIWLYVSTDQVRFVNKNNEPVTLTEVPKIIFSEIMRDVDLFVGVCSVGNDPEWQDRGGLAAFRDYWTAYSFGDLNEVAKTRKEVLASLIPRLKIRHVAAVDGKFLRVKGKVRTYKIHIGSTNILMEPNDQYLCIVPARGNEVSTAASNLFIPFDGDRGLSLILSKAFLLAEDDKITDQTILSQIRMKR